MEARTDTSLRADDAVEARPYEMASQGGSVISKQRPMKMHRHLSVILKSLV